MKLQKFEIAQTSFLLISLLSVPCHPIEASYASIDIALQVETPVALVDKNLERRPAGTREKTRSCAEAFLEYLFTPDAQKEFAGCGFRYGTSGLCSWHMMDRNLSAAVLAFRLQESAPH